MKPFGYRATHQVRNLMHGTVVWNGGVVTATTVPRIAARDAVRFFFLVDCLLPQGWAGDPVVSDNRDGGITIRGCAA